MRKGKTNLKFIPYLFFVYCLINNLNWEHRRGYSIKEGEYKATTKLTRHTITTTKTFSSHLVILQECQKTFEMGYQSLGMV